MSKTEVRKGETIEDTLRRFKRTVSKEGTLVEARNANIILNQALIVV